MHEFYVSMRLRLAELLVWERVLRSTDQQQPCNEAELQRNLEEQQLLERQIATLEQERRREVCSQLSTRYQTT